MLVARRSTSASVFGQTLQREILVLLFNQDFASLVWLGNSFPLFRSVTTCTKRCLCGAQPGADVPQGSAWKRSDKEQVHKCGQGFVGRAPPGQLPGAVTTHPDEQGRYWRRLQIKCVSLVSQPAPKVPHRVSECSSFSVFRPRPGGVESSRALGLCSLVLGSGLGSHRTCAVIAAGGEELQRGQGASGPLSMFLMACLHSLGMEEEGMRGWPF